MCYDWKNLYRFYRRNVLNCLCCIHIHLLSAELSPAGGGKGWTFRLPLPLVGQRSSTFISIASAMALRRRGDFLLPYMVKYMADLDTPIFRAISNPDVFFLINSIFIFCLVVIMVSYCTSYFDVVNNYYIVFLML